MLPLSLPERQGSFRKGCAPDDGAHLGRLGARMGIRDGWARSCSVAGLELWRIEEHGSIAIYMTKHGPKELQARGRWDYAELQGPRWHVWSGDDWVYCGDSMQAAYRIYEEAIGRKAV